MIEQWNALRDYAITGAELYHKYLVSEGKGFAETKVSDFQWVHNQDILLKLTGRLSSTDGIEIRLFTKTFTNEEILPVHYDRDLRTLLVRPREDIRDEFVGVSAQNILVVADLKFLVRRVKKWYEDHPDPLALPAVCPAITPVWSELSSEASPEQMEAIEGILSQPLSYVWGAPGTGKTRFVLARAVLAYCLRGNRVLIVAPTNNAVEQTLYGVLSVLKEAGIPLDKVIRLGVPSHEFYRQYPEVCESFSAEDNLKTIEQDILFYRQSLNYLFASDWYHGAKAALQDAVDAEAKYRLDSAEIEKENRQDWAFHTAELARCAPLQSKLEELSAHRARLSGYLNKSRNRLVLQLMQHKIANKRLELKSVDAELRQLGEEYRKLTGEAEEAMQRINEREGRKKALQDSLDIAVSQLSSLPRSPFQAVSLADFDRIVHSSSFSSALSDHLQQAAFALHEAETLLYERAPRYAGITEKYAKDKLQDLETRKMELEGQTVSVRLEKCLVAAVTADAFIGRLSDNHAFLPYHVFLDEAAYCPLIKCIPLLSLGIPLTLLGDHKQLPPVCVAPPAFLAVPAHFSVSLWAQSALFLEEAFSLSPADLSLLFHSKDDPRFLRLHRYSLTSSFRFGNLLAQVLDRYVYDIGLVGNAEVRTSVLFVHVPKTRTIGKNHENGSEASAAKALADHLGSVDFAVLTPYVDMKNLLIKTGISPEKVFTIHGSQGREWDTVILSVVETTHSGFLTPVLINTAVSRAKKRLILVCDADYWKTRDEHLIGGLLSCAIPFEAE
ncbi:MAG: ATP-binding domain-containing protein [Oscillospiraceae bacterium]|nr:ATP-binding domain-containing protein [Oscillospiraceae bacterium]